MIAVMALLTFTSYCRSKFTLFKLILLIRRTNKNSSSKSKAIPMQKKGLLHPFYCWS